MRHGFIAACMFIFGLCAVTPQPAAAAAGCGVRVESVDENRDGFSSRTIWNSSLFAVTLLAKEPAPAGVSLRAYTLGNAYRGGLPAVRWYPSGVAGIYRSTPVTIAFPNDETLLHVGISGATYGGVFQACDLRLFSAFAAVPRLTLAPLRREDASMMKATRYRPRASAGCPDTPARISVHAASPPNPSDGVPATGGPYVSLAAVHLSKTGAITTVTPEVMSGLSWLDDQALAGARAQQYTPATAACRPVAGTYYFASRFDTADENDPASGY